MVVFFGILAGTLYILLLEMNFYSGEHIFQLASHFDIMLLWPQSFNGMFLCLSLINLLVNQSSYLFIVVDSLGGVSIVFG